MLQLLLPKHGVQKGRTSYPQPRLSYDVEQFPVGMTHKFDSGLCAAPWLKLDGIYSASTIIDSPSFFSTNIFDTRRLHAHIRIFKALPCLASSPWLLPRHVPHPLPMSFSLSLHRYSICKGNILSKFPCTN